ncbi:TraB/GumN family protein [Catenovulum maritimum]|uniref:Polysaccharide biosynthesis protein GumN n=1 Tax=Catenovulum maritimum TaxID=1513271 RepID=A0A0J8GMR2_9ALTE|nr:TraB/GumN family protein [Catenovulum maritimum]KMT64072.1 hypothetical protein XM47_16305 [Catenovulum maritimum]
MPAIKYQMQKYLTQFFIFLFLCLKLQFAFAQPAIWQLEHKNKTSFLFGTIHASQADMLAATQGILEQLPQVDTLVTEINLSQTKPAEINQLILKIAHLAKPKSLSNLLNSNQHNQLNNKLKTWQLNIASFDSLKPWFVALQLSVLQASNSGYDFQQSIDLYVTNWASKNDISTLGLETFQQQLEIFDQQADYGIEMLMETLVQLDNKDYQIANIADMWRNGDLAGLEQILIAANQAQKNQFVQQELLSKRNKAWIKKLKPMLSNQTNLIAVGLMHMVGKDNLLQLLTQNQIKVSRLNDFNVASTDK